MSNFVLSKRSISEYDGCIYYDLTIVDYETIADLGIRDCLE
jgi:hypothetical protein